MFYEILHPKVKSNAQKSLGAKPHYWGNILFWSVEMQNIKYQSSFYLTGGKKGAVEKNAYFKRYFTSS